MSSIRRTLRGPAIGVVAVAMLTIVGGFAFAAIPDGNKVFTACVLNKIGTIRLIDTSLPQGNLMSHCTPLETEISWNQQGPKGDQGAHGNNGTSVTIARLLTGDPNCPTGGTEFTSATGTSYACNGTQGETGGQGDQGPSGTLGSLESLNGLPCTRGGQAGTAQIAYDASGVATITCLIPPGGGGGGTLPPDGFNNTFGTAFSLGTIFCGVSQTVIGTTAPANTEDWLRVTFGSGCPVQATLTADPGIKFDIVDSGHTILELGVTSAQVSSPSPFWIRVYGGAGVTGNWRLSVSSN